MQLLLFVAFSSLLPVASGLRAWPVAVAGEPLLGDMPRFGVGHGQGLGAGQVPMPSLLQGKPHVDRVEVPGAPGCFLLRGLLSPAECEAFVNAAEAIG